MATNNTNLLVEINDNLVKALDKQAAALPQNFNKQRFVQNCMAVLQDSQSDYSKCDARTVVRTLLKGGFLNLDFFNGECYAIPYGSDCKFQTDYKGEVKLCKMYSTNPIKDIYAKLVREGDFFEELVENGKQTLNFKPKPFNDGDIIGAFAVVYYQDGSMMYDTMSKAEIEHTRNVFSKAPKSKAWAETYGEMAKKTVLRRLCKLIDLSFESIEAAQAFDDGSDFDVKDKPKEKYQSTDIYAEPKEEVVDAEYTEVPGEQAELPLETESEVVTDGK